MYNYSTHDKNTKHNTHTRSPRIHQVKGPVNRWMKVRVCDECDVRRGIEGLNAPCADECLPEIAFRRNFFGAVGE